MQSKSASVVPVLVDGEVILDAYRSEDAIAHAAGEDEELARRFGWYPNRSTPEIAAAWIAKVATDWQTDAPRHAWALRIAGVLAGGCELRIEEPGLVHISWWVFPSYRGRGLGARMARLACGYAFEYLGACRVEAYIAPDNVASRGLARSAGFIEQDSDQSDTVRCICYSRQQTNFP